MYFTLCVSQLFFLRNLLDCCYYTRHCTEVVLFSIYGRKKHFPRHNYVKTYAKFHLSQWPLKSYICHVIAVNTRLSMHYFSHYPTLTMCILQYYFKHYNFSPSSLFSSSHCLSLHVVIVMLKPLGFA